MQIVINIPDKEYERFKKNQKKEYSESMLDVNIIANGTPLPKGHGRLIDADSLDIPVDICDGFEAMDYIDGADTIIEADKEN